MTAQFNPGEISIEGMQFFAYHGYYDEEQIKGNNYIVDLFVNYNIEDATRTDNLNDTLNYELLYDEVVVVMNEKHKLLEYVCKMIISRIENKFPNLFQISVKVSKLNPPIKGKIDRVCVNLTKTFI